MKRLITLVIAAVMVLTMIPVMAISSSAAEVEGDWHVWHDPEKYEVDEGEAIRPDPGYKYTDDGFTTIAPDWTNYTPAFAVQTKEAQNLKEGFYMQIRVDDYPYGGEDGTADHWISFHISDRVGITPGGMEHGNNWLSLIRGAGDGNAAAQSFLTYQTTEEKPGSFPLQGAPNITAEKDDEEREIYEFAVTWDGTKYELKINGVVVSNDTIDECLRTWIETGDYYVGVSMHAGVKDASAGLTILKYGKSAEDAITPVGSDSEEPEDNMLVFGEKMDPSTIPANTPALLFDATKSTFKKDPEGVDLVLTAQGDNSYHVKASGAAPYWQWGIKSELTASISDFPVFAMVLKNFWGSDGGIYYCAGDIMSCTDTYKTGWTPYDDGCMTFGEDEEYSLIVVDLKDLELLDESLTAGDGRIHNVRPYFSVTDTTDPELAEWDVMYMGWFRSIEEAQQYAIGRLEMEPVTEAPETEAPETDAPETEAATQAPAADTGAPEETTAAATTTEEGCASVVGFGAVAVLAAAAAFVALKKKD